MSEPAGEDDGLSEYERKFVEAYMGEAMGCGQRAIEMIGEARGHSAAVHAHKVLQRPHVRQAMKVRQDSDPAVLTRIQRLRMYSNIARGTEITERYVSGKRGGRRTKVQDLPTLRERLDALQTLSKICGDFLPALPEEGEGKTAGMTLERLLQIMNQGTVQ